MRVFLIESQSAIDMLNDQSEAETLRPICRLLGHEFASTIVRSKNEFLTAVNHITSINEAHVAKARRGLPLCLHLAAHGDKDGLALGAEDGTWEFLAKSLRKFSRDMRHYTGPLVLVLSSCQAESQKITSFFTEYVKQTPYFCPPTYVITTVSDEDGDVYWRDSVVAWSLFYHQTGAAMLSERDDMKTIIDKIALSGVGALKYFRWDEEKKGYRTYVSNLNEHVYEGC
jgi:hypothetical protein